jgi:hypothetical protein
VDHTTRHDRDRTLSGRYADHDGLVRSGVNEGTIVGTDFSRVVPDFVDQQPSPASMWIEFSDGLRAQ